MSLMFVFNCLKAQSVFYFRYININLQSLPWLQIEFHIKYYSYAGLLTDILFCIQPQTKMCVRTLFPRSVHYRQQLHDRPRLVTPRTKRKTRGHQVFIAAAQVSCKFQYFKTVNTLYNYLCDVQSL